MSTMESFDIERVSTEIKKHSETLTAIKSEVQKVIIGQEDLIRGLLMGVLTNGHLLLEGVPGLAKTLAIKTFAKALGMHFQRVQFTPDLLPADIIGTLIYNPREGTFSAKKGPVFCQILLADEINRAPAKVQSALLEAMEERNVTLGETTHELPKPFLVLATQNPIEQEGTYRLPEAQVDRFLMKLKLTYPSRDEERGILERMGYTEVNLDVNAVATFEKLRQARKWVDQIYMDPKVKDYILDLVHATRHPEEMELKVRRLLRYGASPRATLGLALCSRAHAFLEGRGYVTPHDVKTVALQVLRHRVVLSYEAEAEELDADQVIKEILDNLPVP